MAKLGQRALILGGTGFLGGCLASRLLADGWEVSSFSRRRPSASPDIQFADLEFVPTAASTAEGARGGLRLVSSEPYDLIINALASYGRLGESVAEIQKVNADIPAAVAAYFANHLRESRFTGLFVNLDTVLSADVSPYSRAKADLRATLSKLAVGGLPIVGLRLDQFYGPGDSNTKFITMLAEKFHNKAASLPLSSGLQMRRFIYVEDVVDLVLETVARFRDGRLKCSSESVAVLPLLGVECSIRDVVLKTQSAMAGQATHLDFGNLPDRVNETDPRNMPNHFSYLEQHEFVGLDEGIAKLSRSFQDSCKGANNNRSNK